MSDLATIAASAIIATAATWLQHAAMANKEMKNGLNSMSNLKYVEKRKASYYKS
ncbi:hypothetical protein CPB83DRAFT_847256 [Crepidotus variabilis]|uniref:Uncharacterized protein n=1 Tax=Crepidotus variabilis TaxID=179855 RepID=A0A9P6EMT9_9AGAR|nr:hypothetical protein CPB83DRAFT_847256 [Crepidotus variabilis]